MTVRILLFHRVSPERDPLWDPVPPSRFEKIVRHLARRCRMTTIEALLRDPEIASATRRPVAMVAFDDAYRDYREHALPILERHGCPASLYVVTDCAETGVPPWTFVLDHRFLRTERLEADLGGADLPPALRETRWPDRAARLAYAARLKPWLKTVDDARRRAVLDRIEAAFGDVTSPTGLMMDWEDIRDVARRGTEVGSHSVTHPVLPTIRDDARLRRELVESGRALERKLGRFPATIAYPFGIHDERVRRVARDAGYVAGLAVGPRPYDPRADDPFSVPRIELYSESFLKSLFRVYGVIPALKRLLGRS